MKLYVTILFCSLSIVLSNDLLNTKLNYTVYFRGMEAGEAYLKIQKKIHPDVSPETARLSSIVNEARDVLLNEIK